MAAPAPAMPLTIERVRAAQQVLKPVVPASPLVASTKLSRLGGGWVWLKLESTGPTGSFKVRGAYHAIHVRQKQLGGRLPGVVTASTGNHGAAVAYAALMQHVRARVPAGNSESRQESADCGVRRGNRGSRKVPGGNEDSGGTLGRGIGLV